MGQKLTMLIMVVLLGAAFFALNMLSLNGLRGIRVDATQGSVYTLTQGSKNIAKAPKEKVRLQLYYTKTAAQGYPSLVSYGDRVRETIEEFVGASEGKLQLQIIEPVSFSEAEDEAVAAGLQATPLGNQSFFLGLVVEGATQEKKVIPFFDPAKESLLEYDIARAIQTVGQPQRPVVGLITSLPMQGGMTMDPRTRQPRQSEPWRILSELEGVATINNLGVNVSAIPSDVSVLWVVHPKELPDETLYAIDQFVMKGGRALLCVDPMCDADSNPANPMAPKSSSLARLLDAWGVEVPQDRIAADQSLALSVNVQGERSGPVPYVAWLRLQQAQFDRTDAITGQLSLMHFPTSGFILSKPVAAAPAQEGPQPAPSADAPRATIQPLVSTSLESMQLPASALGFQPDPKKLLAEFVPGKEQLVLAARLVGKVSSAFPLGMPVAEGAAPVDPKPEHLAGSKDSINVVLLADVDMISDGFWTREENLFGRVIGFTKIADNGDFVANTIDNLLGSTDLISIRARETSTRPFKVIEDMRTRAQQSLATQNKAIEQDIETTQREIDALQASRGEDANALVLSAEQQKAVADLKAKLLDARREKRKLQLELRSDIEKLQSQLRLVNMGVMPAVVTIGAIALSLIRGMRRSAARSAA